MGVSTHAHLELALMYGNDKWKCGQTPTPPAPEPQYPPILLNIYASLLFRLQKRETKRGKGNREKLRWKRGRRGRAKKIREKSRECQGNGESEKMREGSRKYRRKNGEMRNERSNAREKTSERLDFTAFTDPRMSQITNKLDENIWHKIDVNHNH